MIISQFILHFLKYVCFHIYMGMPQLAAMYIKEEEREFTV